MIGNKVLPSSGNKARFEKLVCENVVIWGISWKEQVVPVIVLLGLILYAATIICTNPNTCVQWLYGRDQLRFPEPKSTIK